MVASWEQARLDHRAQRSASIASAALTLILEHGAPALTMAAVASAAEISRPTLYRYYPDIDAVLVGIAELIASHDDHFRGQVLEQSTPAAQLDVIVRTVARAGGHDARESAALHATLPPRAREVLARHEDRIVRVLTDVLQTGIDDGSFRVDLEPAADAPLILGLAAAADPADPDRAIALAHRLVAPNTQENPT